ncbi:hypothetical protein RFI_23389 [Reticulomyxa filosa]|uniref:Uncharacterized protein n=1 Tax=Reticulomyxa filosa TaxID=46433 RepID=X6MJG0_RETFI|nr:hypothetical protein RFI_23389 [Reticulomyxa filosa]|eukprot:ETO13979.1 hypothetical protein RFI_23389 [Reticulomyxa filosa]
MIDLGLKKLMEAMAVSETDSALHHDIALLYNHDCRGDYHLAEQHWKRAYELVTSENSSENSSEHASIYAAQLGFLYQYKLKQIDHAVDYYQMALKHRPSYVQVWCNLGMLKAQQAYSTHPRAMSLAALCWKKTLEFVPDHCDAHRHLGNALWLYLHDQNSAEIHLQRAISIFKRVFVCCVIYLFYFFSFYIHVRIKKRLILTNDTQHNMKTESMEITEEEWQIYGNNESSDDEEEDKGERNSNDSDSHNDVEDGSTNIHNDNNNDNNYCYYNYNENIVDDDNDANREYEYLKQIMNDHKHNEVMYLEIKKLLSQCKSDYGGLLLTIFQYGNEAERHLKSALEYDPHCVTAHYYYGKCANDVLKNDELAEYHLLQYLIHETQKHSVNQMHAYQLLGDIYRKKNEYFKAQKYFQFAIDIVEQEASLQSKKKELTTFLSSREIDIEHLPIPSWSIAKVHCGLADCILHEKMQVMAPSHLMSNHKGVMMTERKEEKINKVENVSNSEKDIVSVRDEMLNKTIDKAKRHYKIALKYFPDNAQAHLGLGQICHYFVNQPKESEHHYRTCVQLCHQLLDGYCQRRQLFHMANAENNEKENEEEMTTPSQKNCEEKCKPLNAEQNNTDGTTIEWKKVKLTMDNISDLVDATDDQEILRECLFIEMTAHKLLIDLLLQKFNNERWKQCVIHAKRIISLRSQHSDGYLEMAKVYQKLEKPDKAQDYVNKALQFTKSPG